MNRQIKQNISFTLSLLLRATLRLRQNVRRICRHALLASRVNSPLSGSVVVMGKANVYGTGNIRFGENILLYSDLHLETQLGGSIEIGDNVVLSSGVHIVSMAKITIGPGTMIGEFSSVRDANHARQPDCIMREAGYTATPITIGSEVWIGRGAAILEGVSIGDGATVGANAVVTRDVPAGATVVGVPARPVRATETPRPLPFAAKNVNEELVAVDEHFPRASGLDRVASSQSESAVS
jgi:acetyltransferase-like isoleucine patch superfamily enzyme